MAFTPPDALDISSDGIIYFSDASTKYDLHDDLYGLLESKPYGRFLSYDPSTGEVKVLIEDLYFANGVALSPDEDFVLINESYRYRITRYWLKGPDAGKHEIFVDNLPGFPDNISLNHKGNFWVACTAIGLGNINCHNHAIDLSSLIYLRSYSLVIFLVFNKALDLFLESHGHISS